MKRIIWSDEINPEDWIDENGNYMSYEDAIELNSNYLEDKRANLDVATNGEIICIATVGRWNGTANGYKLLGHRVSNILYPQENMSYCEWYSDEKDIRGTEAHHDSANIYLYRELKGDTYDECVRNAEKLFSKPLTNQRIGIYTKSILPYISEVYGWN